METCNFLNVKELLGAGGYGVVYLNHDGTVTKGIYSSKACDEAFLELDKQRIAYRVFEALKQTNIPDRIYNLVKDNVIIAKPGASCQRPIIIEGREFACYFTMERLRGVSLKMLKTIDPNSWDNLSPEFLEKRGENFEVMVHLSFNSELNGKIYGIKYTKNLISESNPPRGYFINEEAPLLEKMRQIYGLKLSDREIKEIIGFVYGILFFYGKLIPIDIEIALGYYDGKFKINVLDFGMTIDMSDLKNIPIGPSTREIITILHSDLSPEEKQKELERKVKYSLSVDLYCDVDDDTDCFRGWETAKKLSGY